MSKRLLEIIELVDKNKNMTVNELAEHFNVSEVTIRRDLLKLESDKLVIRSYGKVASLTTEKNGIPIEYKSEIATGVKERVAQYAASLVKNGTLVFLDTGSSIIPMGKFLINKDVTVVTGNILLAYELGKNHIKTFILPGEVKYNRGSVSSYDAIEFLKAYHFDMAFISTWAIDNEEGLLCSTQLGTLMKKEAIARSDKVYALSDKTKYYKGNGPKFADFSEVTIITDVNDGYLPNSAKCIEIGNA